MEVVEGKKRNKKRKAIGGMLMGIRKELVKGGGGEEKGGEKRNRSGKDKVRKDVMESGWSVRE